MKKHASMVSCLLLCGMIFSGEFTFAGSQTGSTTYTRNEIRFDSAHFRIVGDLHIPDPKMRQPAIIFVHGDGPAGRSLSRVPNKIMRVFLDAGFACLIYDKPGYGESTGAFTRGMLFEERASILLDAVASLKNHPAVDPKWIGLWGISQAGYVMPRALSRTSDIGFMIAVSCPGVDSVEQSAYLVERQILCDGYSAEEAKKAGRYYRQRARARTYREYFEAAEFLDRNPVVSAMKWGGIKTKERFTPSPPSDQIFFDPITLVEKVKIPVLAIFGENDTQVDPFQGAKAYEQALKKTANPFTRVVMFPDADHGILLSKSGCMKDRLGSRGYAPGYLELMRKWLENLSVNWK